MIIVKSFRGLTTRTPLAQQLNPQQQGIEAAVAFKAFCSRSTLYTLIDVSAAVVDKSGRVC